MAVFAKKHAARHMDVVRDIHKKRGTIIGSTTSSRRSHAANNIVSHLTILMEDLHEDALTMMEGGAGN